jgi:spore photoproduct lyase
MPFPDFEKILIENGAEETEITRRILAALPRTPVQQVAPGFQPDKPVSLSRSKRILYLARFKGEAVKPCPGTRGYLCCGYRILHIGTNCPMDCSYCILQAYFNQPYLRIFVNVEEIFQRLRAFVETCPHRPIRLGTGEFTDSLALDPLTGFTRILHRELESLEGVVVELKTKTAAVSSLLDLPFSSKLIVSWSLNPEEVIRREERYAASLEERLGAAVRCQEKGYLVGFHFDPIFYYPGWEEAYERTVRSLLASVRSKGIAWISLGCFRYLPSLRAVIEARHPRASYIHQEFIPALDGKMRYPQPLRVAVYRKMVEWIRRYDEEVLLYFCMENPSVWEKVFAFVPGREGPTLPEMLDRRIRRWWREVNREKGR